MTDKELVALAIKRNPEALQELVDRCDESIRYAVFSKLGPKRSSDDHEEVVQATYLALVDALPRVKGNSIAAYAYGIAKNQSRQWLTRQTRIQDLNQDIEAGTALLGQQGKTPESAISDEADRVSFRKRLRAHLTPRQEQLYELHYIRDLTIQEIATEMDISPENTRQIRHNIRVKAKALLMNGEL